MTKANWSELLTRPRPWYPTYLVLPCRFCTTVEATGRGVYFYSIERLEAVQQDAGWYCDSELRTWLFRLVPPHVVQRTRNIDWCAVESRLVLFQCSMNLSQF
jgi:hypothetical protein